MANSPDLFDRRGFLAATSSVVLAGGASAAASQQPSTAAAGVASSMNRPKVAAINSIFRLRSHAYHICGRFVHGYEKDGFHHQPPFDLVRMYNDQYPTDDLGRAFCGRHGIEICETPEAALGGSGNLDVDAVLLIIEHGDYPVNELGQVLYPRFEMFERIVEVFQKSGRSVPVFVDKHLSYDHEKAAAMVTAARDLGFGLMAGSSLPVTWRIPEIEPPLSTPFREGVAVFGFDRGPPEIYLFHALEVLQCMLERRDGGESGIKRVECLKGDAVWKAADEGRFSWPLVESAVRRCPSRNVGPIPENVLDPLAILVEYNDGVKGAVINLIEQISEFAFAGSVDGGEPISTCFYLPAPPGARFFDALTWNIERFFASGTSPYPVERTLLTSTALDLGLRSLKLGWPIASKVLDVRYDPPVESGFFRGDIVEGM